MANHINGPLHWERHGKDGPPMVFVHPNPADHTCWTYQMAHFATWFSTIGSTCPAMAAPPPPAKA